MQRADIPLDHLCVLPIDLWNRQWFLLSAGDFGSGDHNCMTVAWGGLGAMWNKPFALVVVRPTRYTRQFMEKSTGFTLCAFGEEHRKKLSYCGSHSGRDGNKARAAGLTPMSCRLVAAPAYQEAELVLECRKTYFSDLDPGHFLDPTIESHYPAKDYHRVYFAEILAAAGTPAWRRD
jgi:flavin reductase (DIM6/NTAB) family NADH-FMN oxidoreductase RutF